MLTVSDLRKNFAVQDGRALAALDGVGFAIEAGKFYTLLGPSGCGKTTTLRSIAGLEQPDSGRIAIGGVPVFDAARGILVPPHKRQIGMVFQSYAIWPHMDVYENVAFPLRVAPERRSESEVADRVARALAAVRMAGYERRPATRLSGGQQQRLALARALVMEPRLLLLDEPLSNLDAKLRESMRVELRRLQRELGITTVYVTHDQTEALALSDTVAVMENGRIVQEGAPRDIYRRPATRFVAEFIGSTNILPGVARGAGIVETASGAIRCRWPDGAQAGSRVLLSIRPEDIRILPANAPPPADGAGRIAGRVVEHMFLGSISDYLVAVAGAELRVWSHPGNPWAPDSDVVLEIDADNCTTMLDPSPA